MLPALLDQFAFEEHRNYSSILLIEHASDFADWELVVDE
jgi:hypothetical protein